MNSKKIFTENNFDLLRLFAALQVVLHHSILHLDIKHDDNSLLSLIELIPGVPIFFFISGYLISKSYESNDLIKEYAQNRILRIYPALIICVLLSVLFVYYSGYYKSIEFTNIEFIVWLFGQLSFYQFYTPDFMRTFGTGVLNGSLWTITVELQFYILVPVLYFIFKVVERIDCNKILLALIFIFLIFNRLYYSYHSDYNEDILFKILGVTFIPWFYMFLLGVFVQKNFIRFYNMLSNRFIIAFTVFAVYILCMKYIFGLSTGNSISPLIFFPMVMVLFSAAYTRVQLSKTLLNKNDISYGLYIYHMPVINAILYLGFKEHEAVLLITTTLTLFLSYSSWKIIEYPSLMLKRHPLNPLNKNR